MPYMLEWDGTTLDDREMLALVLLWMHQTLGDYLRKYLPALQGQVQCYHICELLGVKGRISSFKQKSGPRPGQCNPRSNRWLRGLLLHLPFRSQPAPTNDLWPLWLHGGPYLLLRFQWLPRGLDLCGLSRARSKWILWRLYVGRRVWVVVCSDTS